MKKYSTALILCLIFGLFGIHRFYTGYKTIGIIQILLTITIIGVPLSLIWVIIDFMFILFGNYKLSNGDFLQGIPNIFSKNGLYVEVSNIDLTANNFLKAASNNKYNDINKSIDLLKKSYEEIAKTKIAYPIDTYLRLPMYLQAANRQEEALIEFNNLLVNGYPNQLKLKEIIPFEHSKIYDKMRLFFQREKQNEKAISYGLYSIILDCQGLYLQKRVEGLENIKNIDFLKARITPLLKKAKKLEKIDLIANFLLDEIDKLPNILMFEELDSNIKNIII